MSIPTKKELTHERIVDSASRAIRRAGFDGVSVADIMKDAGLTHGGFYAHFPSREALLVEAVEHAAEGTLKKLDDAAGMMASKKSKALDALADTYLSDAHVNAPESGCALAALGSETRRQSPALRALTSKQVRKFAALIERAMIESGAGSDDDARAEALGVLSTLVGAMVIARAVDKPELSRAVRAAAKRAVTQKR